MEPRERTKNRRDRVTPKTTRVGDRMQRRRRRQWGFDGGGGKRERSEAASRQDMARDKGGPGVAAGRA